MKYFNLPESTIVNRFIPKSKFFEKITVSSKLKQEFTNSIQRITWVHKLSKQTININGTEKIEELHIFHVVLKKREIPKKVLQIIDKTIPYAILYVFEYNSDYVYGMTIKEDSNQRYYFSGWNPGITFDFTGNTIEHIYQKIIKQFISQKIDEEIGIENFSKIIERDKLRDTLSKEISALQSKIKKEKQFNKQIVLNQELQKKKQELKDIK
jgi:hypothetical protein